MRVVSLTRETPFVIDNFPEQLVLRGFGMTYQTFLFIPVIFLVLTVSISRAQYEDRRCKCICPSPAVVNGTQSERILYIDNVPPAQCDCESMVLPKVGESLKGREQEFCPRCECKYENRNITIIKVVVIIVIWITSILVIYMGFLICLDPLLNKRAQSSYQEQTNEEDELAAAGLSHPMRVSGNVLNRVGHQQDKWKKQVQEQRRNIYDKHTMLN